MKQAEFTEQANECIAQMAAKYGKSTYQIMINWGLCRGYAIIPKSESETNQKANMACLDFRMSDEDVETITKVCNTETLMFTNLGGHNLFA